MDYELERMARIDLSMNAESLRHHWKAKPADPPGPYEPDSLKQEYRTVWYAILHDLEDRVIESAWRLQGIRDGKITAPKPKPDLKSV